MRVRSIGMRNLARFRTDSSWLMSPRRRPSGARTEMFRRLITDGPLPLGLVNSAATVPSIVARYTVPDDERYDATAGPG